MIKILQVGLGPLGQKIGQYIGERHGVETVAAVEKNPSYIGKDTGVICGLAPTGVIVRDTLSAAIEGNQPDVAVLSTVSDLKRISGQIEEIAQLGIPIVSTCEELSFPWDCDPELANEIDRFAKEAGIAVVGTGVNPGFLMDALPTFLTAVCQRVDTVEVNRFQDAQFRRLPFQQKIGAGLSLEEFEQRKLAGTLRHVGLTESMQLIADRMGWQLEHTEDIVQPVVAEEEIQSKAMTILKGYARGVSQIGKAYSNGELKITLTFQATVGESESFDEVVIKGKPDIQSRIQNGVNGDIATSAIVLNTAKQILRVPPGLKTMADIPLVSYFQ